MVIFALAALVAALSVDPPTPALPPAWHGAWRGDLYIAGRAEPVPMGIDIAPIKGRDAWTWRITYGEGENAQVRAYELLPGDAPGRFVVDEKNGVLLDDRLEGNVLVGMFEVGGVTLVSRHELVGADELRFEIVSARSSDPRVSNAGDPDNPTLVRSFPIAGYQRATLRRR